ncbi:hypothetical protein MSAN_00633900 [Mycena sanguinolenta]|uniref:Uncharacterized protein n=1 Tax=Mycena sanguinolenta TaxID=230812 RepID=A0A8H6Z3V8_9AGAR|nr:hypothetical protein MSAN_00633900 [Mycena sanguinolenta]
MLLILIAVHLLSRDSIAAPLSRSPNTRASTDSDNGVNNCRTLFNIVWGCLTTIFACTWVSAHPNVPPPNQSRLQLLWRRLKMMLVGIIAPEIMVGFAARQFFAARWLANDFKFSSTQAFFFCMGGFVSPTGRPIATVEQLEDPDVGSELQEAIRNVNEEDIEDKSKGDALSKGIALLQGLWFTVQCFARAHQHLAITQLEVVTLAFAVVNIFIWLLWWNKPLDVQRPIAIGPPTPRLYNFLPSFPRASRVDRFLRAIGAISADEYDPLSSVSVPSFWSGTYKSDSQSGTQFLLLTLVGTVFGAVHCAAWNAVFPTPAEMWIWRTSSLMITGIPGVLFSMSLYAISVESVQFSLTAALFEILMNYGPIYIAPRIILVVLPLVELRFLPASVSVDVNWSTYIPHI